MPGLPAFSTTSRDARDIAQQDRGQGERDSAPGGTVSEPGTIREAGRIEKRLARSRPSSGRSRAASETFRLGRYVITGRIASGGMATVYRGRLDGQGGFAREFAVKVIHPHLAATEGFRERFLDEARVASRVSHPNVVATVDSDFDRGYHFLILELVDGVTLRQLQVTGRERTTALGQGHYRLDPAEAARVVCDAARGLHAVHSIVDEKGETLDVVHRDLSPHNLMLDATGRTVLIDLGLAKARGQLGHTQTGVLCGKLPYMSPEQSRLDPLDARSDVFSLGSVLFELATGVPPFGDDHTPNTLENLRRCDGQRLAGMLDEAGIPTWLTQIILTCLRADPQDRYASAEALAEALDHAMRRGGVIQSEVRRQLAFRTKEIQSILGPMTAADPLPPLITTDPTGSYGMIPRARPWLRAVGLAAAGALLVLAGLGLRGALEAGSAKPSDDGWTVPTLSPNAAFGDTSGSQPAPARTQASDDPTQRSARSPSTAHDDMSSDDTGEGEPEAPRKRKRVDNKRDPLEEFKGNPYD